MATHTPTRRDDRALRRYLEILAGRNADASFLEFRYRVGEVALASGFVPAADPQELVDLVHREGGRTDVYVGCAPRSRRAGTKDAITAVWVLWAECDGSAAARAALAYRPKPPIVVASGSGPNVHAYWPLREPLAPRDAEIANLRLAHGLGADRACFDVGRILRPPGSWNHKHRPPRPVGLLRFAPDVAFDGEEVIARTPQVLADHVERRWAARGARDTRDDPLLRIEPSIYVQALLGTRPGRDRKVRCPFHGDERPSLHVYAAASRGWNCFSCGRGGSVYDLAAGVWGLGTRGREFVDVRRRLLERFDSEIARSTERLAR